jgi:hypothetical protein
MNTLIKKFLKSVPSAKNPTSRERKCLGSKYWRIMKGRILEGFDFDGSN